MLPTAYSSSSHPQSLGIGLWDPLGADNPQQLQCISCVLFKATGRAYRAPPKRLARPPLLRVFQQAQILGLRHRRAFSRPVTRSRPRMAEAGLDHMRYCGGRSCAWLCGARLGHLIWVNDLVFGIGRLYVQRWRTVKSQITTYRLRSRLHLCCPCSKRM